MSIESEALRRYMLEQEQQQQPMSQSDQVVITQSERDVPGFYVDQYQQQQDAFNQALLQRQAQGALRSQADLFIRPSAPINPNYRVVEETTMTATPDGTIVIY